MADKKIIVTKKANKLDIETVNNLKQISQKLTNIKETIDTKEENKKQTSPKTVNRQQQKRDITKKLLNQNQQNKNILKILQIAQEQIISRKIHRETNKSEKENLDLKTIENVVYELLYEDLHNLLEANTEEIANIVNEKFSNYENQIYNKNNIGSVESLELLLENIYKEISSKPEIIKENNQEVIIPQENKEQLKEQSRNYIDVSYKDTDPRKKFYETTDNLINKIDSLRTKESINDLSDLNNKDNLTQRQPLENLETEKTEEDKDNKNIFKTGMSESEIISNTIFGKAIGWLWKKLDKNKTLNGGGVIGEQTLTQKVMNWAGIGAGAYGAGKIVKGSIGTLSQVGGAMIGAGAKGGLASSLGSLSILTLLKTIGLGTLIGAGGILATNAFADMYKGSKGRETAGIATGRAIGSTSFGAVGGAITAAGGIGLAVKLAGAGGKLGAWAGPWGVAAGALIGGIVGLGISLTKSNREWARDRERESKAIAKYVDDEISIREKKAQELGKAFDKEKEKEKLSDLGRTKYLIETERFESKGQNISKTAENVIIEKNLGVLDEGTMNEVREYLRLVNKKPEDRMVELAHGRYDKLKMTQIPQALKGLDIDKLAKEIKESSNLSVYKLTEIAESNKERKDLARAGIENRAIIPETQKPADIFQNEALAISGGKTSNFGEAYQLAKKSDANINKEYLKEFDTRENFDKYIDQIHQGYTKILEKQSLTNKNENQISPIVDDENSIRKMDEIDTSQAKRDKEMTDILKDIRDGNKDEIKDLASFMQKQYLNLYDSKKLHGSNTSTGSVTPTGPRKAQAQEPDHRNPTITQPVDKRPFPILQSAQEQQEQKNVNTVRDFSNFNPEDPLLKSVAALRTGAEKVMHVDKYGQKLVYSSTVPEYNKDKRRDVEKQFLTKYMAPRLLGKESIVTSNFGYRPENKGVGSTYHKGIDFRAQKGSSVYAFGEGKVIKAGVRNGFGNVVAIELPDGTVTQSAHLDSVGVKVGDIVKQGDFIGYSGGSGTKGGRYNPNSYSPHLDQTFYKDKSLSVAIDPVDYMLKTLNKDYKKYVENPTKQTPSQASQKVETKSNVTPPNYLLKKEEPKQETVENNNIRNAIYNQNVNNGIKERLLEKNNNIVNKEKELNTVVEKQTPIIKDNGVNVKVDSIPGYTQPINPLKPSEVFNNNQNVTRYKEAVNNQIISENKTSNVTNNTTTNNNTKIANNTNKSETMAKAPTLSQSDQAIIEASREMRNVSESVMNSTNINNQNINNINNQNETNNVNGGMSAVPESVVEPSALIPLLIQYMFGIKTDGTNSNQLLPGMV